MLLLTHSNYWMTLGQRKLAGDFLSISGNGPSSPFGDHTTLQWVHMAQKRFPLPFLLLHCCLLLHWLHWFIAELWLIMSYDTLESLEYFYFLAFVSWDVRSIYLTKHQKSRLYNTYTQRPINDCLTSSLYLCCWSLIPPDWAEWPVTPHMHGPEFYRERETIHGIQPGPEKTGTLLLLL